ncbi:sigma-70 family RNA polymerase sigma factor [Allokutzneria sp. A3M-2-11 16]|uniref:sigma-70 family RNA polymerase sigma factor n=1 Tax=Allokutzneria sp. A3M-2-11 16 TaxID=2962043 RepID=UPI0020B76C5D|nr:sigma-70 family RNA polymerase sigma factor [Allokutzneria sp. A3M-2-11 16]MCP3798355.1 sigma-70 family RNA polymerase sigma factor [Allokutzneria sp. A3M-2-11 16]
MDDDWLAERFEENRGHLRAVAFRMLGSVAEAEDAVQETWLRLSRTDTSEVRNLSGWLTTVVGRVCLDVLRSRASRREEPLGEQVPEQVDRVDPESQALQADSVGLALLVVLDTLAPAERLAFVLHDLFGVPFEEIALIVGRSPAAARQLASRARRRVRGSAPGGAADQARQREVVEAFLAASRNGDFQALLAVLDPDVVLRADEIAVALSVAAQEQGAPPLASEVRGAGAVADAFVGRAQGAQPALVDGVVGAVWAPDGTPRVVLDFVVAAGRIVAIEVVADAEYLSQVRPEFLAE